MSHGRNASRFGFLGSGLTSLATLAQPDSFGCGLYSLATLAQPDSFGCGLYSLAMLAQPDSFGCGLYSLAMLAQPDRRTEPSLIPRGAFLACLGAARLERGRSLRPSGLEPNCLERGRSLRPSGLEPNCLERGRSLRPSGLEPAWGAAVAALIPAIIKVILGRRWYEKRLGVGEFLGPLFGGFDGGQNQVWEARHEDVEPRRRGAARAGHILAQSRKALTRLIRQARGPHHGP